MSSDLDVPRLRQLAMIVRHHSFSKAAEQMGISQPALSKNIRTLERALGVQLLERGRFGAIPTAFGLALVRHADSIDAELRSASQEIEALRVARSGHARIGCGPSEATRLLPTALGRLRTAAPGIQVTILYGLNEALDAHGEAWRSRLRAVLDSGPLPGSGSEATTLARRSRRRHCAVWSSAVQSPRTVDRRAIWSTNSGSLPRSMSWSGWLSINYFWKLDWWRRKTLWRPPRRC